MYIFSLREFQKTIHMWHMLLKAFEMHTALQHFPTAILSHAMMQRKYI